MKWHVGGMTIGFLILQAASIASGFSHDSTVVLWPGGAPQSQGTEAHDVPALTIHLPEKAVANGAAVIVNPGGGYGMLASDHEGLQVARWLNSIGVTAFVLRYRVKPEYDPTVSLIDAQRAIRFVRYHAEALNISADRIGMLGFSAGGNLASAAGTRYDAGDASAQDPIDRMSSRPDCLVLVYPVINGELFNPPRLDYFRTDTLVTKDTPPTFLVQTHEDGSVSARHALLFYGALLEAGVPAEMHIFGYGGHGLGLAPGDPDLGEWPNILQRWLRSTDILVEKERIAVSGSITLDGEALRWGWLTLIPENPYAPIARVYINDRMNGMFSIDKEHGPLPGVHRAEVHVVCRDRSAPRSGAYSIDDAEHYTRPNPISKAPLCVEVREGESLSIEICSK